ncbi:hypothetical protein Tco_0115711 [Tanacetum coccineum]
MCLINGEIEKEDPALVTKYLANNFNELIEKLSFDANTSIRPTGWEDPKAHKGSIPTVIEVEAAVKPSFASVIHEKIPRKVIKIRELRSQEVVNGAVVTLPFEAMEEVNSRFSNTLYGYFIGKKTCFETKDGMESVMENSPWLIRLVPLILNVWTPNTILKKDVIKHAPVWVKMHHVPIVAYSEIGLSLITTQIGKPIMLDTYTSNMCLNSRGRSTYARALIEVAVDIELKESMIIVIPLSNREGHTFATVDIEYEWTPPRCKTCMIFDHVSDKCPKLPKVVAPEQVTEDGFSMVKKKKTKSKNSQKKQVEGVRLTKPSLNLQYRRVERGETSNAASKITQNVTKDTNLPTGPNLNIPKEVTKQPTLKPRVVTNNSFSALSEEDVMAWGDENTLQNEKSALEVVNDSDSEDIDEHLTMEEQTSQHMDGKQGASTSLNVIFENKLSVCDILESHVSDINLDRTCHAHADLVESGSKRVVLPWCLLRDFNDSLFVGDTSTGSLAMDISMREFKECVEEIEVTDVQCIRVQFTWNQKPKGRDGVLKKLDRILANLEFYDGFMGAHAIFKPYRISDHSPSVLNIPTNVKVKSKPFKFYNVLCFNDRFNGVVKEGWATRVSGFYMFQVVQKLKALKKPLQKLLYDKGNLHTNVSRLRADLDRVQSALDSDLFSESLLEEEANTVVVFNDAFIIEEKFLKQKAKIEWLKEGDSNSAHFHKAVKSRASRSRIHVVTDANGVVFQNKKVTDAFISHYEVFLRQPGITNDVDTNNLFQTRLTVDDALNMVWVISDQEVKEVIFSMGNDKSPGPDGYTAAFFKEAWDTVGSDVTYAVREFFVNGHLLKEINHTIIALILKVKAPACFNDYRPISYCNVIFKYIRKIIANRIKESLKTLISPNQSAFILGRSIADNILLTQEIMHNYHLDRGVARCAFKVDIQKAYDTVN